MTEEVLQHIWQYQLLVDDKINKLKTVDGCAIKLINVGLKNTNQGPDFLNSKLFIDDVEWNGNVEIHLKSSLWEVHNHHNDVNYDNVILHVVLEDDKPVKRKNGESIPCVELKGFINQTFVNQYDEMIDAEQVIPCTNRIEKVRSITKRAMLERVLVERLERKSNQFETWLYDNNKDWEQTTFEVIAYCFGLNINTNQFRDLVHWVTYKTIQKHLDNQQQIESLLFGNAGFLNASYDDDYSTKLKKEYDFLNHKYQFKGVLTKDSWNFHRIRPSSFPTVRIAQLASFLINNEFVFSKIKEISDIKELRKLFKHEVSSYWQSHYDFDKIASSTRKTIGAGTIDLIIINGVLPLLYLYYKQTGDSTYLNRIFHFLEEMKSEGNSKISSLSELFEIKSAYDSQSVLELFDYYCSNKKCLECSIFSEVL